MLNLKDYQNSAIKDLVETNYVFAAVLHHFGIHFYQYEENTLFEVCKKYKLNARQIVLEIELWAKQKEPSPEELFYHPIEVLVAYLQRKHYYFIRQELPFLADMVAGIKPSSQFDAVMSDLKIMFPLFVTDFIHHIHEEESKLFERIKMLHQVEDNQYSMEDALEKIIQHPVVDYAHAHDSHDDEMQGIRKLTHNYHLPDDAPVSMKVLFNELQHFESELIVHAQIEDQLLFPKAVELEKFVLNKIYNSLSNQP
jgi:regulator of cell morphogenesis and NO signaling